MRLGVKFSRTGRTRFVSHLDMQRLFSRALRRSGLPVKFSQGFNPHIVTSFASALAVGMETHGDYMEFYTTQDVDLNDAKKRLNDAMPDGIEILKLGEMAEKAPKLMAASAAARVNIVCDTDAALLREGILKIIDAKEYIAQKKSKGKVRELDIRPLIFDYDLDGEKMTLTLAHSGAGSLSPALLIDEAKKLSGATCEAYAVREDLLIERNGKLVSMGELLSK